VTGTVYLLHFDQPYKHARHYVGWASNVRRRLAEHEAGRGARLLAVVRERGSAGSWPGCGQAAGPGSGRSSGRAPCRQCPLCGSRRGAARNATGRCRGAGPLTRRSPRPGDDGAELASTRRCATAR